MTIWVVGQFIRQTAQGNIWDFQGAFDSRDKAIEACRGVDYFMAPVEMNAEAPPQTEEWPGVEYPKATG